MQLPRLKRAGLRLCKATPDMGREVTYVILVRHGERLDEADREAWKRLRTHDTQYDPPLTAAGRGTISEMLACRQQCFCLAAGCFSMEMHVLCQVTTRGWKQSSCAGKQILQDLKRTSTPVACIYSSPTSRTMSTAAAIASQLGTSEVTPAYGLNCCAAAKKVGVSSRYFARPPDDATMKRIAVARWPPVGDVEAVGRRNRSRTGFVETVRELASAHASGEAVVMVSHREGIWEVLEHLHKSPTGKYCSTHYLKYHHDTQHIQLWNLEDSTFRLKEIH